MKTCLYNFDSLKPRFYSERAAATCDAGRRTARGNSMVQHMYVSLPSNQTGNKHFVCSLSVSQLMWQIYLYLSGPNGKIPESGTKILTL